MEESDGIAIAAARRVLMHAICQGDNNELKKQLAALSALGVKKLAPLDSNGATALNMAAERGNAQAIEILLDWGDIDAPDASGNTALMSAAYQGALDSVKLLANASNPFVGHGGGQAAADLAVILDRVEVLEFLVSAWGNPPCKKYSKNLLHVAAMASSAKCAKFLIDHVDPDVPDAQGETALALAIAEDCAEIVAILAPLSGLGTQQGYKFGRENPWTYSAFVGSENCLRHFLPQVKWRHKDSDGNGIFDFCLSFGPPATRDACAALLEGAVPLDIGREMLDQHGGAALPALLARIEAAELAQTVAETAGKGDTESGGAMLGNGLMRKNRL